MKVLVVDQQTLMRRGIRELLKKTYPLVHVQEARSIAEVQSALATEEYDLMILDLLLTDGNAFDHVESWARSSKETSIQVYSMCSEQLYAKRLAALGCRGFLSKEASEERLLDVVNALYMGRTVMGKAARAERAAVNHENPFAQLTDGKHR